MHEIVSLVGCVRSKGHKLISLLYDPSVPSTDKVNKQGKLNTFILVE